jgi:hypothetical protein
MTHSTTVEGDHSGGSVRSLYATLDITSLDNANNESFDPTSEFDFDTILGVSVLGLEEPENYIVQFDHLDGTTLYVEGYGGTDPTATTDVGEVRVRVDGDPAPSA